jgi:hypothetical protein
VTSAFICFGREVLRLVEDHEAIEEGAAAHEVQRADLDAIAQQVVGRGASPVAAFAGAREHLEVVHECAHPRLHLSLPVPGRKPMSRRAESSRAS